jgi:hypothetical protein
MSYRMQPRDSRGRWVKQEPLPPGCEIAMMLFILLALVVLLILVGTGAITL